MSNILKVLSAFPLPAAADSTVDIALKLLAPLVAANVDSLRLISSSAAIRFYPVPSAGARPLLLSNEHRKVPLLYASARYAPMRRSRWRWTQRPRVPLLGYWIRRFAGRCDAIEAHRIDASLQPLWALLRQFSCLCVVYAAAALISISNAAAPRLILPLPRDGDGSRCAGV